MESLSGLQIGCARNVAAPELNLCGADYGLAGLVSCSAVGTWIYAVSRARCRSSLTAFLGTEPDLINTLNPSWLCTDPSWESLVARLLYQKGLHMGCAEKQVAPQRDREIDVWAEFHFVELWTSPAESFRYLSPAFCQRTGWSPQGWCHLNTGLGLVWY